LGGPSQREGPPIQRQGDEFFLVSARAGIERTRGTSSDSALETLLTRELVALNEARLCLTTCAFLDCAGLRDLADLPPLQDLASDDANQAWGARV
jgi:chromosome segregation and condensation protein ScpB